jgi:K+-transporting ATPase KdpF subunit
VSISQVIGLVVAVALCLYFVVALLAPQRF